MIKLTNQDLGYWAEQQSCYYLQQHGFQCLQKRYQCRYGEIDLIMVQHSLLLFVEVKARSNDDYGHAHEMLTRSKQKKLYKTAQHFLMNYPDYDTFELRFDFISIQLHQPIYNTLLPHHVTPNYTLNWVQHAFTGDEYI